MNLSLEDMKEMGKILLHELMEQRCFRDASQVYLEFLKDVVGAIDVLLQGFFWTDALLLIRRNELTYLISTKLEPTIVARKSYLDI